MKLALLAPQSAPHSMALIPQSQLKELAKAFEANPDDAEAMAACVYPSCALILQQAAGEGYVDTDQISLRDLDKDTLHKFLSSPFYDLIDTFREGAWEHIADTQRRMADEALSGFTDELRSQIEALCETPEAEAKGLEPDSILEGISTALMESAQERDLITAFYDLTHTLRGDAEATYEPGASLSLSFFSIPNGKPEALPALDDELLGTLSLLRIPVDSFLVAWQTKAQSLLGNAQVREWLADQLSLEDDELDEFLAQPMKSASIMDSGAPHACAKLLRKGFPASFSMPPVCSAQTLLAACPEAGLEHPELVCYGSIDGDDLERHSRLIERSEGHYFDPRKQGGLFLAFSGTVGLGDASFECDAPLLASAESVRLGRDGSDSGIFCAYSPNEREWVADFHIAVLRDLNWARGGQHNAVVTLDNKHLANTRSKLLELVRGAKKSKIPPAFICEAKTLLETSLAQPNATPKERKAMEPVFARLNELIPEEFFGSINSASELIGSDYRNPLLIPRGALIQALERLEQPEKALFANRQDDLGQSALHKAILLGDLDAVELLIGAGAHPLLPDRSGKTPWLLCAKSPQFSPTPKIKDDEPYPPSFQISACLMMLVPIRRSDHPGISFSSLAADLGKEFGQLGRSLPNDMAFFLQGHLPERAKKADFSRIPKDLAAAIESLHLAEAASPKSAPAERPKTRL